MSNQSRQPKGQSTGGQFAASQNPESTLDLDIDNTENGRLTDKRLIDIEYYTAMADLTSLDSVSDFATDARYDIPLLIEDIKRKRAQLAKLSESVEMLRGYYITSDEELSEEMHNELNKTFDVLDALPKGSVDPRPNPAYADVAHLLNAGDIRTRLIKVPDDEPVIAWVKTKETAEEYAERPISHEQWAAICLKVDKDQDLFDVAYDVYNEAIDAVPTEEES